MAVGPEFAWTAPGAINAWALKLGRRGTAAYLGHHPPALPILETGPTAAMALMRRRRGGRTLRA